MRSTATERRVVKFADEGKQASRGKELSDSLAFSVHPIERHREQPDVSIPTAIAGSSPDLHELSCSRPSQFFGIGCVAEIVVAMGFVLGNNTIHHQTENVLVGFLKKLFGKSGACGINNSGSHD